MSDFEAEWDIAIAAVREVHGSVYDRELAFAREWADAVTVDYDEGPCGIEFKKNGSAWWFVIDDMSSDWDADDPRQEFIHDLLDERDALRAQLASVTAERDVDDVGIQSALAAALARAKKAERERDEAREIAGCRNGLALGDALVQRLERDTRDAQHPRGSLEARRERVTDPLSDAAPPDWLTPDKIAKAVELAGRIVHNEQPKMLVRQRMVHALEFLARALLATTARLDAVERSTLRWVADHDDAESVDDLFSKRVDFRMERMDDGHYWMAIILDDGTEHHFDLTSKRKIRAFARQPAPAAATEAGK